MNPSISAICVTYGRTALLANSIECFLRQKYSGPAELIVLNTCPKQTLILDRPNVRIINLTERPASLGEARNMAIEAADGQIIVTWDDDDAFTSWHLDNIGFPMSNPAVQWVWLDKQFYAEGHQILKIVDGQLPCLAFRKSAWEKAGKYVALTVGEDRHFAGRLSQFPGQTIKLADDKISFIYSWANGAYHISGLGMDRTGVQPAHDRAADDLKTRIGQGLEPVGKIVINPRLKLTPEEMFNRFMNHTDVLEPKRPAVCVVELGRYGDIINILPACQHIAENYQPPHLMVSREFASVLDGVSYVIPEIVDISYDKLVSGMAMAKKKFPIVLRAQIWGRGHVQPQECASYNRESWKEVGLLRGFDDQVNFPLVFDKRDARRELDLYNRMPHDKPLLLCNISSSVSSPFPQGGEILANLRGSLFESMFEIVDVSQLHAERIYDMVGLMDRAVGLISIDSAQLHLAAASDLPVLAIVNDQAGVGRWTASEPRCNCHLRYFYSEIKDDPSLVLKALNGLPHHVPTPEKRHTLIKKAPKRRLFHSVEKGRELTDNPTIRRTSMAQESWDVLYQNGTMLPAHYTKYLRDARGIGDRRDLPYFKDVLDHARQQARPEDIIVWTNDDNWIHPQLPAMLEFYAGVYGAVCGSRCDFKTPCQPGTPDQWARRTQPHMGRDMFAFTREWLDTHWDDIGDVILGASIFDLYLCAYIRKYHGIDTDRQSYFHSLHPAEIPRGYIGHQMHDSQWQRENPRSPAEFHNRTIFKNYADKHLKNLHFTAELAI